MTKIPISVYVNSYNVKYSDIDLLLQNEVELHIICEDFKKYKEVVFNLISYINKRIMCYVHINDWNDIHLYDINFYNTYECILCINYIKDNNYTIYKYLILPKIKRLVINYNDVEFSDIIDNHFDINKLYYMNNGYYAKLNFSLNDKNYTSTENFLSKFLLNTNNLISGQFIYNSLYEYHLICDNNYIIPYNDIVYDTSICILYYKDKVCKNIKKIHKWYKSLFIVSDMCKECNINCFCTKVDVDCDLCKLYYNKISEILIKLAIRK